MSTSCPKEGGHTTLVNKVMLSNKLSSFKRPFFNAAFKKDNDNTSSYRCCESNGGHCSGGGGGWVPKSGTGCRHVVRQLSKIITIVKKSQVSKNHKCQTPQVSNTTSVKHHKDNKFTYQMWHDVSLCGRHRTHSMHPCGGARGTRLWTNKFWWR